MNLIVVMRYVALMTKSSPTKEHILHLDQTMVCDAISDRSIIVVELVVLATPTPQSDRHLSTPAPYVRPVSSHAAW